MTFDLDSPVGRKMIEAARAAIPIYAWDANKALAAALRVAEDDTCKACDGFGLVDDPELVADPEVPRVNAWMPCPNPDCKDGRVTPAFVSGQHAEYLFRQGENMRKQAAIDTRAQVLDALSLRVYSSGQQPYSAGDLEVLIERREKELSIQRRRKP